MFQINSRNFYDSNGNKVSEEEFKSEDAEFKKDYVLKYNAAIDTIVSSIPDNLEDKEKLKTIYQYLVSSINYDSEVLDYFTSDGLVHPVLHKTWNNWGLLGSEKYAPILLHKGICTGIAPAFKDLCDKIGIPCEIINGKTRVINNDTQTRLGHVWNVVKIDGQLKHVDVRYGIFNRDNGLNIMDFFLVDNATLKQNGPHNSFDETIVSDKVY